MGEENLEEMLDEVVVPSGKRLTIDNSEAFLYLINDALLRANKVVLEFDSDLEIDISALQIICSACRSAAKSGKTFIYRGYHQLAMGELSDICGMERYLGCKYNNDLSCIWF